MAKLHDALVAEANVAKACDVGVRDGLGAGIEFQGEPNNGFQPMILERILQLRDEVLHELLVRPQSVVEDGAECSRAVWAPVSLRDRNPDVLNLLQSQFTHFPEDTGTAK